MRSLIRSLVAVVVAIAVSQLADAPAARAEGIVTNASTAALVNALRGGGLVQMTFTDTLVVEAPLLIATDTVLEGAGSGGRTVTLSGGSLRRILHVLPGVRLDLVNCTLRDALSTNGGAIVNEGILRVTNVTFTACKAKGSEGTAGEAGEAGPGVGGDGRGGTDGGPAYGGALVNFGDAVFADCVFLGNQALGGNGGKGGDRGEGGARPGRGGDGGQGAVAYGGAIWNGGTLSLERCVFTANSAEGGDGGAGGSEAAILGAGQGGGGADAGGGAVFNLGELGISQCAFATNLVTGGTAAKAGAPLGNIGKDGARGGSARGGALASPGSGWIVNSTFHTNLIAGGNGGTGAAGGFTVGDGGDGGHSLGAALHVEGSLSLTNVTLAWNSGTNGVGGASGNTSFGESGASGRLAGSAIATEGAGRVWVVNSILAARDFSTVDGDVLDLGYNVFSDAGSLVPGPGSVRESAPFLSEYRVWTQGTPGMLPLQGSPAIDLADPGISPKWDQRGLARLNGVGPDSGAMEGSVTQWTLAGRVTFAGEGLAEFPIHVTGTVSGTTFEFEGATDKTGAYRFERLYPGIYLVVPGAGDFKPPFVQVGLTADVLDVDFVRVAPVLAAVRDLETGRLTFSAQGVPGRQYRLERAVDLKAWETAGSATADATGKVAFESQPAAAALGFFRLLEP